MDTNWSLQEDNTLDNKLSDIVTDILSGNHDLGEYYMQLSPIEFYKVERRLNLLEEKKKKVEESRYFMLGERKIWFSTHSIQKYRERHSYLQDKNDTDIRLNMKKHIESCHFKKVNPRKRYRATQLLNHNLEVTEYYMDAEGYVYVIVGEVLKTVHHNESKRYS